MKLAPGHFLWLLANDVRLNWRRFAGMLGAASRINPWAMAAAATIVSHLLAWPVACGIGPLLDAAQAGTGLGILAGIALSIFSWMIAQSLFGAMRTLYDRGDLDLLMGSPLPAYRIFAAKALGVAASTIGSIAVLALPLVNALALTGRPQWFGVYPTLLALGLLATALALLLAIGLFFWLGARRARLVMQLAGAAIGGGFVLAAQIVLLLPDDSQAAVLGWLAAHSAEGSLASRVLGVPVAAMAGDALAILQLLVLATMMFAAAVLLLADRFARASLAAAGAGTEKSATATQHRSFRFRTSPAAALRRKEWRLLARDPGLFAQISLQIIYTIPLVLVLVKSGSLPIGVAAAPSLVVIIAQVAASLAWITVSGEDAPELIASAPVTTALVDRSKLSAIALPVLALLAIPVAALALVAPLAALAALLLAAGASVSSALLNLWHPMPGNRRGMLRRHSQSKLLALIEHMIAVLWAVATVLLLLGTAWFLAPIGLASAVLAVATPAGRPWLHRLAAHWPRRRPAVKSPSVETGPAAL